jgi:hypothetical protein
MLKLKEKHFENMEKVVNNLNFLGETTKKTLIRGFDVKA